jgi:hypothetical protein
MRLYPLKPKLEALIKAEIKRQLNILLYGTAKGERKRASE